MCHVWNTGNQFQYDGVKVISDMLKINSTLKSLFLEGWCSWSPSYQSQIITGLALDRPQNRWWWRKTTHRIAPLQHDARRDLSWWFVYKLQPRFDVVLSQPQRFMPQTTRSLMKRWVLWGVCQSSFTFGWSNFLHFFGFSPFSLPIKTHHKATVLIHTHMVWMACAFVISVKAI